MSGKSEQCGDIGWLARPRPVGTLRVAFFEGEAASVELLATLTGLKARSLHEKARKEGWRARRGRDNAQARLRPLLDRLTRQAEALGTGEAGPRAAEFAALPALLKTIQLLADMTGGADDRAERIKENDERLATILGRVDDRIVELAHAHAEELLGAAGARERQRSRMTSGSDGPRARSATTATCSTGNG